MTKSIDDDDVGRGALRDHLPRVARPPALDQRIHDTLTSRGLIRPTANRGTVWVVRTALLAAGIVLGVIASSIARDARVPQRGSEGAQYALLLYGDTEGDTGAVHAQRAREYGQWASTLKDDARWVGGQELGAVLDVLGPTGSIASPTADRMAGVFIIEAASPARAAEVARTCPHLKYGGRVVLMSVVPASTVPDPQRDPVPAEVSMSSQPTSQLLRSAPYFPVGDVERSAAYYERVLGFRREYVAGSPPQFAIMSRDGLSIMLRLVAAPDLIRPNEAQGGTWDAFFWVSDVRALHAELQRSGAEVVYGPLVQESYRMTEFAVRDRDGHVLGFGQPL